MKLLILRGGRPERGRRGNILVTLALSLIVLLGAVGLGVDYAMLVADASRLQQSCDFAALAGALKLKNTPQDGDSDDVANARADADRVARDQMDAVQGLRISFAQDNTRIRVEADYLRRHYFIRVLGFSESTITRWATAEASVVAGLSGAAPLAITTTDYNNYKNGDPLTVRMARNQDEAFNAGDVLGMSPDQNSSKPVNTWENEVQYGLDASIMIGQEVVNSINADTRNQGRRLVSALATANDSRIARAAGAPWNDTGTTYTYPSYPGDDPRVMTILVCDPKDQYSGTSLYPSTVDRLIAVYLEDSYRTGTEAYMRIRILPYKAYSSETPGLVIGGPNTVNSGLYVIRLIDDLDARQVAGL